MIKHFCDYCEREIEKGTYGNTYEVKFRALMNTTLEANITLSTIVKGGIRDPSYEICKYCLVDLVNSLDDRPKPENLMD